MEKVAMDTDGRVATEVATDDIVASKDTTENPNTFLDATKPIIATSGATENPNTLLDATKPIVASSDATERDSSKGKPTYEPISPNSVSLRPIPSEVFDEINMMLMKQDYKQRSKSKIYEISSCNLVNAIKRRLKYSEDNDIPGWYLDFEDYYIVKGWNVEFVKAYDFCCIDYKDKWYNRYVFKPKHPTTEPRSSS